MRSLSALKNRLLVAMPTLQDPLFSNSVAYICEHSREGAMGIIINRPLDIKVGDILTQLNIDVEINNPVIASQPILAGGPVGTEQGFILHHSDTTWKSTLKTSDKFSITTSNDILHAMARGDGPRKSLVSLGYAGWGAGQLERELIDNYWVIIPADPNIIFEKPYSERWEAALSCLGITANQLCSEVGHA